MKYLVFLLLLSSQTIIYSQSKKKIVKYQLKSKTEKVADYEDGNGKFLLDEVHVYDKRGNTIQETTYDKDGKLKSDIKYFFDANNQKIKEERYNAKNKLVKTIVYTYNEKGLKATKKVFNGKGKLLKEKTYTYEYY